jgi:hypothetical protein
VSWRSHARDLTMAARGARGAGGDPYPRWHEMVKGLGRSGVGEGWQWWSKLNEKVLRARGCGEGSGDERGGDGRGCGTLL